MRFLQLLEQINEVSVNPVYRQMETHSTREDPYFQEMEEAWSGGVGDFGDPRAAYAIQRHPSYYDYHDALVQSVAGNLGDPFTAYRLLPMEQLETWKQGADLPPMGISVSKRHAEAFRRFAPNRNRNDLVLVTFPVPAEAVIMLGHEGEQELVIDPNHVSAHTLNMLNEGILVEQSKCGIYNALEKYRPDLQDKYEKIPPKRINSSILFLQDHGLWDDHAQALAMEMTQLKRAGLEDASREVISSLIKHVIGLIKNSVGNPPVPYRSDPW